MDLQMKISCQTKQITGIHCIGKSIDDYGILPTKLNHKDLHLIVAGPVVVFLLSGKF
jgi:hypothetical protein